MHEHVTCKPKKKIMGSAQSKPTRTHQCNKVNTHLKCMKHCYNADVMQCMMFLKTFKHKPVPKFHKNFKFWKNPKVKKNKNKKIKIPKIRSEI